MFCDLTFPLPHNFLKVGGNGLNIFVKDITDSDTQNVIRPDDTISLSVPQSCIVVYMTTIVQQHRCIIGWKIIESLKRIAFCFPEALVFRKVVTIAKIQCYSCTIK